MVSTLGNVLSYALNQQVTSLQNTQKSINVVTSQLATGKRVNSALDNPNNFFTAFSLSSRASDFNKLLDGINQSVRTIQQADSGITAINSLLSTIESATQQAISDLSDLSTARGSVSDLILADNPEFYFRLNETSGTTANNLGSGGLALNGTYAGGFTLDTGALYYSDGDSSATFDGATGRVNIPNSNLINTDPAGYPAKTIELFFNADNVNLGKQVLYEQGGTGNAISIYVDSGNAHVEVRDQGDYGPFNINAPVESGTTYHLALVLDDANSTFTGYLNGEVIGTGTTTKPLNAHGGAVAIGRNEGGTYFHDGANGGNGEHFKGRISDVASYNKVLSQTSLKAHYQAGLIEEAKAAQDSVEALLTQFDPIIQDSSYLGVNLLQTDTLTTYFNPGGSSSLETPGADFSLANSGLSGFDFSTPTAATNELTNISNYRDTVASYTSSLSNHLSIIDSRSNFIQDLINEHQAGSDDLTQVDEEGASAELLALQARKEVQISTLALSSTQPQSILSLYLASPLQN